MVIHSIEQVSSEVMKIFSDKGLAFFIRTIYLNRVNSDLIFEGAEFSSEDEEDIVNAGMAYSVEIKALDYLSRAEQCRSRLTQKLLAKNYERTSIDAALDYLTERGYLSDYRFACAWLSSRKINHFEGRTRLLAELLSRGVEKTAAMQGLDEFFEENAESDLCAKAAEKLVRCGKTDEKLVRALIGAGFSYSLIRKTLEEKQGL